MYTENGSPAIALTREFITSFNTNDWPRLEATLRDDVVYEETGTGRQAEGPDEYIDCARDWKRALPDMRGTVRNAVATGDSVAVEITWKGTNTGPFVGPSGTLHASGKPVILPATLWFTLAGGRVQHARHYIDLISLLVQMGALRSSASAPV